MKNWLFILLILSGFCFGNAQNVLSDYKYVIVPTKFEGFKKQNQYQTSTLIKYLLVQRGINAVYEDALPSDLYIDKCLGVKAILVDESGTFTTKAHIAFQDCQLQEVYRTKTGNSKIKDYKGAFQEAIREAFESLDNFTYEYQPKSDGEKVVLNFKDDVKSLDQEVEEPVEIPEQAETRAEEIAANPQPAAEKQTQAGVEEIEAKSREQAEEISTAEAAAAPEEKDNMTWYAQEIANGYQLVDRTPEVRLRLYKTKQNGVFLAENDTRHGIVYLKDSTWYFDYYEQGILIHKPLIIKF